MKKIISVIIILCMALALSACATGEEAPEGMKDVAPDGEKYNFYVPEAWRKEAEGVVGAMCSRDWIDILG